MKTKSETKQLCDAFKVIRDIPYILSTPEYDCSCSSKIKILGEILIRLGLDVKVMTCDFQWTNLPIPLSLSRLATEEFGISRHYFLNVKGEATKYKWVQIDPTWDIKLKQVFPIAEWNGISDTILAVPTVHIREYTMNDIPVSLDDFYFRDRSRSKFSYQFNRWLNTIRKNYERNT